MIEVTRILVVTSDYFFPFLLHFFFLSRNHLPKVNVCFSVSYVKKSSGAINHSFLAIAFELTARRLVKEKPRRFSLNRIDLENN